MSEAKEKNKENNFSINPEEMTKAGLHFGHKTSKCHPKMKPYLAGVRNTIHIIDVGKTAEKLKEVLEFIQEIISQNKILLLIGTKIQVKDLVKEIAIECNLLYVNERWLGGTITNFAVVKKRIDYFKDLEKKKAEGGFEKYTKKERLQIDQKLRDLEIKFGGLKKMETLPDAIFVLDMKKDETAIREAKRKGIKTIAIAHTNNDPTLVDCFIPANDDSISSVRYILEKVKEVILKAKQKVTSNE